MSLKIAIIGAGPAGCMLARLLLQSQQLVSVAIFEGEKSLDFRSQGGTLDLHDTTGQKALKTAGLFDEFKKHARYDGEALKITDKKLLAYVNQRGSSDSIKIGSRPEIDRPQLREMLFNSLPASTVRWNKKLTSVVRVSTQDELTLHFADGTVENKFDLIVGADGAWSKVRTLLTDEKPYFSGIGGHSFYIPDAQERTPELYNLVNCGSVFSWSDGKSIMAQYMGEGSINISAWGLRSSDWQQTCGHDVHDPKAVKEACLQDYAGWDPKLVAFTQIADDDTIAPRDLYMLPVGHKWDHVPGVTLIGDAAHLMTPFAGEGVNLAFEDCLKLSEVILSTAAAAASTTSAIDSTQLLHDKVRAFEQDMFTRARETQQMTYDMMTAMYMNPSAPRIGIEKYILRAMEGELGKVATWCLTPVVYLYYFVFKLIW